jgi:2-keto-4-pentenoate hydratase/2-oxohepta-3-ene-1,7-dioic acid hydratase in catechol pathway
MPRYVLFTTTPNEQPRVGVLTGDGASSVIDLTAAYAEAGVRVETMRTFLELGETGKRFARSAAIADNNKHHRFALSSVQLKAPIYDPEKVICVGMNYTDHCTEQNFPIPTEPVLFSKFPSTICGGGDPIVLAPEIQELDFEVELAIVIGKRGRRIAEADALDYVAGWTVCHDVSARHWQLKKNAGQWLIGKTFDSFCPIGPAIVTRDEISDPNNLGLRTTVNGRIVQDSSTSQFIFNTQAVVAWCSKFFTLSPGDLILTGTPPGVGCFRKPPMFLKAGDVVTVITNIQERARA